MPRRTTWTSQVGDGFFQAFERPILAGRDFHEGDRAPGARTVIVNEAFARRRTNGASPIGRRVRYVSDDPNEPPTWLEIVGMVRDIGMTPTDFGEAPYIFHAASLATVRPVVMDVHVSGDAAMLALRARTIAAELEPGLRVDDMLRLDEVAWRADLEAVVAAGALVGVVGLGLFLSSAGIFSLMSVNVSRRTREIGLRAALGANPVRLLRGVFSRAVVMIGGGLIVGNLLLLLLMTFGEERVPWGFLVQGLVITSTVMMTTGLLACVGPARRALRIHPTDALRET